MSDSFIELDRTFHLSVATGAKTDDVDLIQPFGRRGQMTWKDLLAKPRVVILSGGGSGKTMEIRHRAKLLHEEGRPAFFLRIEHVRDDFVDAFDKAAGTHQQFQRWVESGDEGWVFLDSVDEARLKSSKEFELAIARIGNLLEPVLQRAHILITSREAAWRARTDREHIRSHLPFEQSTPNVMQADAIGRLVAAKDGDPELRFTGPAGECETEDVFDAPAEEAKEAPAEPEANAVLIVAFDTLSEMQVETFVRARGVEDVAKFMRAVQLREAQHDTARPLDLDGLIVYWNQHGRIGGQFELTEATVDRRLGEVDPDRAEATSLTRDQLRQAAEKLAAANMLMQLPDIRLPNTPVELRGVEPADLLSWSEKDIRTLLLRPLFVSSQFGAVRLYVQKAREFLTAQWLSKQLADNASRVRIEALLFRTQYGREVVVPAMRGVLPWLALLDAGVLARVHRVAPEVMFEGGDPSRLPLDMRRELLSKACEQLAQSVGRSNLTDFQAVQRFAAADLADHIKSLMATYREHNEVAYFLMRMVWQGEIAGALDEARKVAASTKDLSARLIALRAIGVLGTEADRASVRDDLLRSREPPEREWVAETVDTLPRDAAGLDWLLQACGFAKPHVLYSIDPLSKAVESYAAELPESFLPALVAGLQVLLLPETFPNKHDDDGHRRLQHDWLMGAALTALDRLVQARDPASFHAPALKLLQSIPAAMRLGYGDDRKDSARLGERVAAWQPLNRALFWAEVEGTRARRLKKSAERLVDVWHVGIFGHFWRLSPDDFDYFADGIVTRPTLDDRLVALSVAHSLCRGNDQPPAWRQRLKLRVKNVPELKAALQAMLAPPSEQVKQRQRQQARWERRSMREAAQRIAHHAKWHSHLQANLDALRTPHPDGGVRQCQHYLATRMREFEKNSSRWAEGTWGSLIPEFGVDVAEAFRDGAIAFWRTNTPDLLSSGAAPNSTAVATTFGLTGLLFESRTSHDWAARLSASEAELAAGYAMRELNGFPRWLPRLFVAHPDAVAVVVLGEIDYELRTANAIDSPSHYVLNDLSSVGRWMWSRLAPQLLQRLDSVPKSTSHLRDILIILSGSTEVVPTIGALARMHARSEVDELSAIWFATWLGVEPEQALPALAEHLARLPEKTRQVDLAMHCLVTLTGGRHGRGVAREAYREVVHLSKLYLLMQQYIVESEDLQRAGTGSYSPGLRDDAQDARDGLLATLRDTPGQEAFFALQTIAVEHPSERGRAWAARLAQARAVADADRPGWASSQVKEFQVTLTRTPRNHQELHDLAVERLIDLKHSLEHGETSLAALLLDREEVLVRNFVADWLTNTRSNRYSIAQEEERAEGKRTDIRFVHIGFDNPVPVELKLANQWSGAVLVERLENQLCNDYLRDQKSSRGVFMLIHQGGRRFWDMPDGTRVASIEALTAALQEHWAKVGKNFSHVEAVHVIGIDLTLRAKPMGRSGAKRVGTKPTKKDAKSLPTVPPARAPRTAAKKAATEAASGPRPRIASATRGKKTTK